MKNKTLILLLIISASCKTKQVVKQKEVVEIHAVKEQENTHVKDSVITQKEESKSNLLDFTENITIDYHAPEEDSLIVKIKGVEAIKVKGKGKVTISRNNRLKTKEEEKVKKEDTSVLFKQRLAQKVKADSIKSTANIVVEKKDTTIALYILIPLLTIVLALIYIAYKYYKTFNPFE